MIAALDRRLLDLIQARARRRSPILRLLPPRWTAPLLVPAAERLRATLLTGLFALSTLVLAAALWLTSQ